MEAMAYLYNKFRVAATEVKRQVLKRKGEHVSETPPKVHPACVSNLIVGMRGIEAGKRGGRREEQRVRRMSRR